MIRTPAAARPARRRPLCPTSTRRRRASAFPQQPGALFPDGAPIQWQPAPYTTSGEGYWQKTQRFLQELSFEHTYLYGDHTDPFDLEINRTELSSTFAIPILYNIETPLLVTPGFAANWLEGPLTSVPPTGRRTRFAAATL